MPDPSVPDPSSLHERVLTWYAENARALPWRRRGTSAWAVLVSEVMLQQTPVQRVLPVYEDWLRRWPQPRDLAADAPGEAVRQWGRLGYPRRALRLHAAATVCIREHEGAVPSALSELRALPGVGEYTAAAVASFAFGQRHAVLDTNVRRVHARVLRGEAFEPPGGTTAGERAAAVGLLPDEPEVAARWGVAVMELGALVCTARSPGCARCPLAGACRWRLAGHPEWAGPPRRGQRYDGTDRQARGRLLAVLREASGTVSSTALAAAWPDAAQRARALDGLVADGLVEPLSASRYRLPGR